MRFTIGAKIVGAMAFPAIAIGCALAFYSSASMSDLVDQAIDQELRAHARTLSLAIAEETTRALSLAEQIAELPIAGQAMANNNRQALRDLFLPSFAKMRDRHGVRQFQFHLPPATSYFRVHKPEKYGDDLSAFRKTVLEVNQTQKPRFGIEKGVAGLGIRGVVPVFHEERHVGSVEFGMSFGQAFLEGFAKEDDSDLRFYVKENGNIKNYASTIETGILTEDILEKAFLGETGSLTLDQGTTHLAAYAQPVKDFSGEIIGVLEIIIDGKNFYDARDKAILNEIIFAISVVLLAVVIGFFIARTLAHPITMITKALRRYADRDFSAAILWQDRTDEIGDIARASQSLKERGIEIQKAEEKQSETLMRIAAQREQLSSVAKENLENIVQAAVETNEAMGVIARMVRDVRCASEQSQTMASAIEEMVASVNEIAASSNTAAEDARSAENAANEGVQASGMASDSMKTIFSAVQQAAEKVNRLAEASAQIGEIVEQIESIAGQTNLLALNATIEAARAGEAGKGFAVVAAEVKNLASQTGKATEDIRSRIENLRHEMAEIVSSMTNGAQAVDDGREVISSMGTHLDSISGRVHAVTDRMEDIASILSQQSAAAHEVSSGTSRIADLSARNVDEINSVLEAIERATEALNGRVASAAKEGDAWVTIEVAKNDHIAFKTHIIATIIGRDNEKASTLPDHHTCRLGRWYDAINDDFIKNSPDFKALEQPHRHVHGCGKKALEEYEKGNIEAALNAIDDLQDASHDVLTLLDRLAKHVAAKIESQ